MYTIRDMSHVYEVNIADSCMKKLPQSSVEGEVLIESDSGA